jgi:uncharacterized DUF497 family protein
LGDRFGEFDGFEWDLAKSEATFKRRGIGFERAKHVFDGGRVEYEDLRRSYGEHRYVAIGEVEGNILTVVWTPRGRRRRIIAARSASKSERRAYHEYRSTPRRREAEP